MFFDEVYNGSLSKTRFTIFIHSIFIKLGLMADLHLFYLKRLSKNKKNEALKEEHESKSKGVDS